MARRTGKSGLVALLAAGAITLGAMPAMSAPAVIKASGIGSSWNPGTLRIPKGKRVVWKNPITSVSGNTHNVRSIGQNWNFPKTTLQPGESTRKRFKRSGTFRYRCTLHSRRVAGKWTGMIGKIKVTK